MKKTASLQQPTNKNKTTTTDDGAVALEPLCHSP